MLWFFVFLVVLTVIFCGLFSYCILVLWVDIFYCLLGRLTTTTGTSPEGARAFFPFLPLWGTLTLSELSSSSSLSSLPSLSSFSSFFLSISAYLCFLSLLSTTHPTIHIAQIISGLATQITTIAQLVLSSSTQIPSESQLSDLQCASLLQRSPLHRSFLEVAEHSCWKKKLYWAMLSTARRAHMSPICLVNIFL